MAMEGQSEGIKSFFSKTDLHEVSGILEFLEI